MKKSNLVIVSVLVSIAFLSFALATPLNDLLVQIGPHAPSVRDLLVFAGQSNPNTLPGHLGEGSCVKSYDSAFGYAVCACSCKTGNDNYPSCGGGHSQPMSEPDYKNLSADWCNQYEGTACVCIKNRVVLP